MVLVDSNVLLDVLSEDPRWGPWADAAIRREARSGPVVINPVIYAEISVKFSRMADLDALLAPVEIERMPIPFEAAFLAGKAFQTYRGRHGAKTSPLPDFFIGAHAAVSGYRLITRDVARYRTYFPTVVLIAPAS